MRPRIPLAVTAVALTSVVTGGPALAADDAGRAGSAAREPTCATPHPADFPISTRIHGGPTTYHPGGGFRTWFIDLTNRTDAECADIHPVLVLIDKKRTLATRQIQLEFSDGKRRHPVRFERTDQDENIGVFDDGFPGFRVGPGKTVTVQARLTFTSDAVPNSVVANAAVVQRRDDDGDWVGQSRDYRFTLTDEEKDRGGEQSGRPPGEQRDEPGAADDGLLEPGRDSGTASGRPTDGPGRTTTAPIPTPTPTTDTGTGTGTGTDPGADPGADPGTGTGTEGDHSGGLLMPGELARTGPRSLRGLGLASGALLVVGAALVAGSRRLRTDRG
ncbi:hypothetical protein [Streptomyces sp. NBC_00009]|uniref:hypothetical protein n=1 Tax=Streptomyces sp. NBC_00009 TaxID=2975620 RepID=UPI003250E974